MTRTGTSESISETQAPCKCFTHEKYVNDTSIAIAKSGRDDWIRTSDPLTPSQVRYQAALHPVRLRSTRRVGGGYLVSIANGPR
jgi:hypothetical protein